MHLHHFEVPLGTNILNLFSGIVLEVSPFWKKLINNITARQESNFFPPFHREISPYNSIDVPLIRSFFVKKVTFVQWENWASRKITRNEVLSPPPTIQHGGRGGELWVEMRKKPALEEVRKKK